MEHRKVFQDSRSRRFIRLGEVQSLVGLGRSAIYAAIKAGTFPSPYAIGVRARAWDSTEIERWMESCISAAAGDAT